MSNKAFCSCDNTFSTPAAQYPRASTSECNQDGLGWGGVRRNAIYTSVSGDSFASSLDYQQDYVVRAIASKEGWANSDVVISAPFKMRRIAMAPTFTPDGGTSAPDVRTTTFGLQSNDASTTIRYTVNGNVPSESGGTSIPPADAYSWQRATTQSVVATTDSFRSHLSYRGTYVVRAIAYRAGWATSDISNVTFVMRQILPTPYFDPNGATPDADTRTVSFKVLDRHSNTSVYYTVNGNAPTGAADGNSTLPADNTTWQRATEGAVTVPGMSEKCCFDCSIPSAYEIWEDYQGQTVYAYTAPKCYKVVVGVSIAQREIAQADCSAIGWGGSENETSIGVYSSSAGYLQSYTDGAHCPLYSVNRSASLQITSSASISTLSLTVAEQAPCVFTVDLTVPVPTGFVAGGLVALYTPQGCAAVAPDAVWESPPCYDTAKDPGRAYGECVKQGGGTYSNSSQCLGGASSTCYNQQSDSFTSSLEYAQEYVLRAIAAKEGFANSDVATSLAFKMRRIVQPPAVTPNGANVNSKNMSFTVACDTSTATIRYTVNGNVPTVSTGSSDPAIARVDLWDRATTHSVTGQGEINDTFHAHDTDNRNYVVRAVAYATGWATSDPVQSRPFIVWTYDPAYSVRLQVEQRCRGESSGPIVTSGEIPLGVRNAIHIPSNCSIEIRSAGGSTFGSALVFSGQNSTSLFNVEGNLTLKQVTLRWGHSTGSPGAILVNGTSARLILQESNLVDNVGEYGGAIGCLKGYMSISKSLLSRNSAKAGGAIHTRACNVSIVDDSRITSNVAPEGGGIATTNETTLLAIRSSFDRNKARETKGGGLLLDGKVRLNAVTVSDNTASTKGGAIYTAIQSTVTITNMSSLGNTTLNGNGGALYINGQFTVADSVLSQNTAPAAAVGGAMYIHNEGNASVSNVTLSNNTASCGGAIAGLGALHLVSSACVDNAASVGGAVYGLLKPANIVSTLFSRNAVSASSTSIAAQCIQYRGQGGAIALENVNATDCVFEGNTASKGGAVTALQGDRAELTNSQFLVNKAVSAGGAIYIGTASSLHVKNSTFSRNQVRVGQGGAVFTGSVLRIEDSTFEFNNVRTLSTDIGNSGGALYCQNFDVVVNGSKFTGNRAYKGGSIMFQPLIDCEACSTARPIVLRSHFNESSAVDSGGGIMLGSTTASCCVNHATTVRDCTFVKNTAVTGGALASVDGTNITVEGSNFTNCDVTEQGGALFASKLSAVSIASSSFVGNTATGRGGAIFAAEKSTLKVQRSQLLENKSGREGGGICGSDGSDLRVTQCSFTGNTAETNAGALLGGGGSASIVVVDRSTFDRNKCSRSGGALFGNFGGRIVVTNTVFKLQTAMSGGALASEGNLQVVRSNFSDNQADRAGGAMDLAGSNKQVSHCLFTGNVAGSYGGALHYQGAKPNITIANTDVRSNRANKQGGGIFVSANSEVVVTNSQIRENDARVLGGGVVVIDGQLNCTSCSLTANSAPSGGALVDSSLTKSSIVLTDSVVSDNGGDDCGSAAGILQDCTEPTCSMRLHNVTLSANRASTAVALNQKTGNASLLVENSRISLNVAQSLGAAGQLSGGATFRSVAIESNTVVQGDAAGLLLEDGNFVLVDTNFSNNSANQGKGGGLVARRAANVSCQLCVFHRNEADVAGGVFVTQIDTRVSCQACDLTNNSALSSGGAGGVQQGGLLQLLRCTVARNTAVVNGGGIEALSGGEIQIQQNEAARRSASERRSECMSNAAANGGCLYAKDATMVVHDTVIGSNEASAGGGFWWSCSGMADSSCNGTEFTGLTFTNNTADGVTQNSVYVAGSTPLSKVWPDKDTTPGGNLVGSVPLYIVPSFNGKMWSGETYADCVKAETLQCRRDEDCLLAIKSVCGNITASFYDNYGRKVTSESILEDIRVEITIGVASNSSGNETAITRNVIYSEGEIASYRPGSDGLYRFNTFQMEGKIDVSIPLIFTPKFTDQSNAFQTSNNSFTIYHTDGTQELVAAPGTLNIVLQQCRAGYASIETGATHTCSRCGDGAYGKKGDQTCRDCELGAVCYGGADIRAKKGYWSPRAVALDFYLCPFDNGCAGGGNRDQAPVWGSASCTDGYTGHYRGGVCHL